MQSPSGIPTIVAIARIPAIRMPMKPARPAPDEVGGPIDHDDGVGLALDRRRAVDDHEQVNMLAGREDDVATDAEDEVLVPSARVGRRRDRHEDEQSEKDCAEDAEGAVHEMPP